jgi:putative addiction module component (TIGR02574 family)
MTPEHQALFQTALALPEAERARLVDLLLESLSPDPEDGTEEKCAAELDRRRAEVEQGLVKPIPCSEVRLDA